MSDSVTTSAAGGCHYVYIRDEERIWLPGKLERTEGTKAYVTVPTVFEDDDTSSNKNTKHLLSKQKYREVVVNLLDYPHKVLPLQNVQQTSSVSSSSSSPTTSLVEYADMVELPYLHEAAILFNMKLRHKNGKPYTRTGDIIIAMNPYQWFHDLYTPTQRQLYSQKLVWQHVNQQNQNHSEQQQQQQGIAMNIRDIRANLAPHVYEVSALAYRGLVTDTSSFERHENQSILVSGESGAGKTETVKIMMNHLASIQYGGGTNSTKQEVNDPVVQRVVDSNPLLEAFGNAKTRRNDNSSRFGKYIQLQFDTTTGSHSKMTCPSLVGSVCDVYLLEKNRVINHDGSHGERTFHIFYQLLTTSSSNQAMIWDGLVNTTPASYKYMSASANHQTNTKNKNQPIMIEGQTDVEHYDHTIKTLQTIGITGKKLQDLLRTVCAVLVCGNITFGCKKGTDHEGGGDADQSVISDESNRTVQQLCTLLGLESKDSFQLLQAAFTERTMSTRNETYKVPLNVAFANEARDAFAKELYGNLFLWLVREINTATMSTSTPTNGSSTSSSKYGIIGLLDIFGFESFHVNRFEQLCINYANEKLQQKFTEDIFRSVQTEYELEGIDLAEISYDDNTHVLELIEGRTGLLALLNEECVRPKGNDFDFVQKALVQNQKSMNPNNGTTGCLLVHRTDRTSFAIHHYAGVVMYDASGFVSSNQDTLPTDLANLCLLSSNPVVSEKVTDVVPNNENNENEMDNNTNNKLNKRQKSNIVAPTVWSKYKSQLTSLMTNLRSTRSRYIRCIKPNTERLPYRTDHVATVEQLRCAGVVAAVTLSRSAFPNKVPNTVVRFRYGSLLSTNKENNGKKTKTSSGKTKSLSSHEDEHQEKVRDECERILTEALRSKEEFDDKGRIRKAFVVGKTRTYFRAGALEYLEGNRLADGGFDIPATTIQAVVRGFLVRRNSNQYEAEARRLQQLREEEEEQRLHKLEMDRLEQVEIQKRKEEERQRTIRIEEEGIAAEKVRQEQEEMVRRQKIEEEEEKVREHERAKALEKEQQLQKRIEQLQKELAQKQTANQMKIQAAREKVSQLENQKIENQKRNDELLTKSLAVPVHEIEQNKKKILEGEKLIEYLRKENRKVQESIDQTQGELSERNEENHRLCEMNVTAGLSLDTLERQNAHLADSTEKLASHIQKWKKQNQQLIADLRNRKAYYEAEMKIKTEYQTAMDKILAILQEKTTDPLLLEEVRKVRSHLDTFSE